MEDTKWLSRKFLGFLFISLASFIFVVMNKATAQQFFDFQIWLFPFYLGANVSQSILQKKGVA